MSFKEWSRLYLRVYNDNTSGLSLSDPALNDTPTGTWRLWKLYKFFHEGVK